MYKKPVDVNSIKRVNITNQRGLSIAWLRLTVIIYSRYRQQMHLAALIAMKQFATALAEKEIFQLKGSTPFNTL